MKRRDFLNLSIPATGAILVAPGFMNKELYQEINHQFITNQSIESYDVVINGAGFGGYFAAIQAAKQGKSVLVVEKRASPGYEVTAKHRLWVNTEGLGDLSAEHKELFFPEAEKKEVFNKSGAGINNSVFGNDAMLFNGTVRKGLLRNLLVNKVHVLLMTDACGLIGDSKNVTGVLLASKHGIHTVKCKSFIDASDNALFSRRLAGESYKIDRAGFVIEVHNAEGVQPRTINVDAKYGLSNNQLILRPGKYLDDQAFLEFQFPVKSQKREEIEHQARFITAELGRDLALLDGSLAKAHVDQLAVECSVVLKDDALPDTAMKGHYIFSQDLSNLKAADLPKLDQAAKSLVDSIRQSKSSKPSTILVEGGKIPWNVIKESTPDDPGLMIPLKHCSFDFEKWIRNKEKCQVLVAGGGTAGAMAGMGAVEKSANTIVVDYFNDMGGTKTMGGVMGYYHGYKDHVFFKKQDQLSSQIANTYNLSSKIGRKLFHLKEIVDSGNRFLSGSIMCGTLVEGNTVKGIVVCRDGALELIEASITIDATGDADLAYFAGANYWHGDSRTGLTQNFSQWDRNKGHFSTSNGHRDYDMIDNTRISELQRGLFLSHYQAHFYDFSPMLTVRESRRIEGLHVIDLIDAVEDTHFSDVMTYASSDFDPHTIGSSEYSKCGFLLPHSNDLTMEIPYKSLVPKGIDGMLLSGRGISQTHNALQFTRMSADLAVLGYLTGQVAADQAWNGIQPKDYNITGIQKEWAALGYLKPDYATKPTGNLTNDEQEIERRVAQLANAVPEYLYECIKLPKEKAVPVLYRHHKKTENKEGKLLIAKALAWFGEKGVNDPIIEELKVMFEEEHKAGYPEDFVDTYDDIRGRPKNILLGLYWRINQNIALMAMSGDPNGVDMVRQVLDKTWSGGRIMERESEYYNGRIDLKLVPYYNRILAACFYAERLPDQRLIAGFEKLLGEDIVKGYKTEEYDQAMWRVYGGNLELSIGSALARCGAETGFQILSTYLMDIHHNFKTFAKSELNSLTGEDFGYDSGKWKKYITGLSYPMAGQKLNKEVEV